MCDVELSLTRVTQLERSKHQPPSKTGSGGGGSGATPKRSEHNPSRALAKQWAVAILKMKGRVYKAANLFPNGIKEAFRALMDMFKPTQGT